MPVGCWCSGRYSIPFHDLDRKIQVMEQLAALDELGEDLGVFSRWHHEVFFSVVQYELAGERVGRGAALLTPVGMYVRS